jgi:hypothetical protein
VAHTWINPEVLINSSLGVLEHELVLASFTWRDADVHFTGNVGPRGDVVNIRVPARTRARELPWRSRTAEIQTDELHEGLVGVRMNRHAYNAIDYLDEYNTLSIGEFGPRVLAPQSRAVAAFIDGAVATTMETAPYVETVTLDPQGLNRGYLALRKCRSFLNRNHVDMAGRFCIVGQDLEDAILDDPNLIAADSSGSTGVLREAHIGRLAGFDVYVSQAIPPAEGYAFHRTAFPLVNRAPAIPRGVSYGAEGTHAGYALRYVQDYDSRYARERSLVSTFFGTGYNEDFVDPMKVGEDDPKHFVRGVKIILGEEPVEGASTLSTLSAAPGAAGNQGDADQAEADADKADQGATTKSTKGK